MCWIYNKRDFELQGAPPLPKMPLLNAFAVGISCTQREKSQQYRSAIMKSKSTGKQGILGHESKALFCATQQHFAS